jgi:hypothetical protein
MPMILWASKGLKPLVRQILLGFGLQFRFYLGVISLHLASLFL